MKLESFLITTHGLRSLNPSVRLFKALGDTVIALHHVGRTAIEDLAAGQSLYSEKFFCP